jgi:phosphatidylserine/phosphatidylglycerophosphate/cardiolipin synthase-like enzyme
MNGPRNNVLLDDEITPQLLKLIGEAKSYVVLVSPYVQFWGHLKTAIERARGRGIKVDVLVREDDGVPGGRSGRESVDWLLESKIAVHTMPNLHAKIYLNEQSVMIASMNLTESSATNSSEVAVLLDDRASASRVRAYVEERLFPSSQPVPPAGPVPLNGRCIRCGDTIPFDPSRPLCESDYDVWAEFKNEDYEEELCHRCGEAAATSYAKPLCRKCYKQRT